jgi:hypothetical protein
MSETTIQNDTTTTNDSGARYTKVQTFHAPPPVPPTSSFQTPEQASESYVKAYRAVNNSVVVTYNRAEAHARTVRKQINRLLNA